MAVTFEQLNQLYLAYFGRPADFGGVQFYTANEAATVASVAAAFSASPESQALYGDEFGPAQVNAIYKTLFGREAEPAGLAYWTQEVAAGRLTPAMAAYGILVGAQNADATAVANKLTVAAAFYDALDTTAEIVGYSGNTAATAARNYIATVTADEASVTAAQAKLASEVAKITAEGGSGVVEGSTFTLTTAVDSITGTAGNDTITAVVDAAASGGTLTSGDVVNGGAGTDTANFVITTNGKWAAGATVTNVEKLFFRNVSNNNDTLDLSNVTGATEIWSSGSTGAKTLTVQNIQGNAALGIANTSGADGLVATFKDGTVGTGGTVTLAYNAAGKSTAGVATRVVTTAGHAVTANTATDVTLALVATGTNYAQFTDGANSIGGLKTITVSGTGSLDVVDTTTEFDNVTVVNASANTGGFTIDLGANNKNVTFTGGSGNDTITLPNFNANDSIDGGAGNDTLNIALTDAVAFTKAAPVKNVETLGLTVGVLAANQTLNADYFGISNVTLSGATLDLAGKTLGLSNLANGTNVTFKAATANAGTVAIDVKGAVAGTSESATLTFGKALDLTSKAVTINAAGLETITLATATTSGGGAKLATLTDAQLTTLNITGSDGITLGTLNAAPVSVVNASGVVKDAAGNVGGVSISLANSTKAVTFTGGQGADTYTASGKGDTITGGLGADTITLGAGADKLIYNAANESTAAGKDTVASFNTTADSIQFAAALQQGTAAYIGAAAFTANGSTQLRMNGADLEVDFNGDATADLVVTLTGVSAADFGAANFTFA